MRAKDLVKGNIAYHDQLNPEVWKGDELRVDVRYKLLEIAKRFIEYLEVPNFKLVDVILRGSLVNYNYTQYSDFDLHLVTDYKALDCNITEQFYMAKKRIWNDEHDITIKGHEVELYVEDIEAKNISEGTYSVLDARWLRIPEYRKPSIDDSAVNAKARDLMTQINRAIKSGSVEDITRLQDKIKNARQAGLDKGGEFSTENLAFKIVRNKGYLDKLYKNKTQKFDQELSIDESAESYSVRTDSGEEYKVNDEDHAVNKARSLLSYKKASKVYILKNGKAIYSWTLGTKLEPLDESEGGVGQVAGIGINGKQFNFSIKDLIAKAQRYPIKKVNPQIFAKQLASRQENPTQTAARAQSADLQYPIIVVQDGNTLMIADGTHRAQKAIMNRLPTINAHIIPVQDMAEFSKQAVQEDHDPLDHEVREFLNGLTPDDVGVDEVGDYIVHYEGFTDQCQDTEEYRRDPNSVFDEVWSDFRKREGDKDPINYGIVGEHDYPIVYSVFRR